MEATTTITTPVGATFTHSAWVQGDTPGTYDVEVGPRLTFRRTLALFVKEGDLLMDTFGQPTIRVERVTATPRQVSLLIAGYGPQRYEGGDVLNVFVSSEQVAPTFRPGVTPESAL